MAGSGVITALPFTITPTATPKSTTDYVLSVENAGCPNLLLDTFHVRELRPLLWMRVTILHRRGEPVAV